MLLTLPPARRGWIVTALGIAQTIGWASSYYIPAVLAAPMAASFGLSPVWVFGAFSMAMVVSATIGPWAGARVGRRGGGGVGCVVCWGVRGVFRGDGGFGHERAGGGGADRPDRRAGRADAVEPDLCRRTGVAGGSAFSGRVVRLMGYHRTWHGHRAIRGGICLVGRHLRQGGAGTNHRHYPDCRFCQHRGLAPVRADAGKLGLARGLHWLGADPPLSCAPAERASAQRSAKDHCPNAGRGRGTTSPTFCALVAGFCLCSNLVQLDRHGRAFAGAVASGGGQHGRRHRCRRPDWPSPSSGAYPGVRVVAAGSSPGIGPTGRFGPSAGCALSGGFRWSCRLWICHIARGWQRYPDHCQRHLAARPIWGGWLWRASWLAQCASPFAPSCRSAYLRCGVGDLGFAGDLADRNDRFAGDRGAAPAQANLSLRAATQLARAMMPAVARHRGSPPIW